MHIGTHKTGSTAIQHALKRNEPALEASGYTSLVLHRDLPEVHRLFNPGHYGERGRPAMDQAKAAFARTVETINTDNVVVSGEDLTAFYWPWRSHAKLLRELLAELAEEINLIVYFRRQDKVYESGYLQQVRAGRFSGSIEDLVHNRNTSPLHGNLNWYRKIREYTEIVGANDLKIGIYDLLCKRDKDIFHDFCHRLNIEETRHLEKSRVINTSIPCWQLPLFIHGRKALSRRAFGVLEKLAHLSPRTEKHRDTHRSLLSLETRRRILDEYSTDNRALCVEYDLCDEAEIDSWLDINH